MNLRKRSVEVRYLKSQNEYMAILEKLHKENRVLYSGPLKSMISIWNNSLMLLNRSPHGRLSTLSRRTIKTLQEKTSDKHIKILEDQGINFIIISLCSESL